MSGHIFNIQDDGTLVEMNEQPFASEDIFQKLLSEYPNLLAGDQIQSSSPRRWLLVKREMGVPDREAGGERWSLDHLFLDQDAIPTLVEVKRSSDTRIRREVVGQMLDYAANAIVYWPVEKIQAEYEQNCQREGVDPEERLAQFLDDEAEPEEFWQQVKTNLQAKNIRLLFVADVIPSELRRIVEFLNEVTDPVEVLAVEIRHYAGEGLKTLVPRVIGQMDKRVTPPSKRWDEESFMEDLDKQAGPGKREVCQKILQWTEEKLGGPKWGRGAKVGSFSARLMHNESRLTLFTVMAWGSVSLSFKELKEASVSEEKRRLLEQMLNEIPGLQLGNIERYPELSLSLLIEETATTRFLDAMDWVIEQIKAS